MPPRFVLARHPHGAAAYVVDDGQVGCRNLLTAGRVKSTVHCSLPRNG